MLIIHFHPLHQYSLPASHLKSSYIKHSVQAQELWTSNCSHYYKSWHDNYIMNALRGLETAMGNND